LFKFALLENNFISQEIKTFSVVFSLLYKITCVYEL